MWGPLPNRKTDSLADSSCPYRGVCMPLGESVTDSGLIFICKWASRSLPCLYTGWLSKLKEVKYVKMFCCQPDGRSLINFGWGAVWSLIWPGVGSINPAEPGSPWRASKARARRHLALCSYLLGSSQDRAIFQHLTSRVGGAVGRHSGLWKGSGDVVASAGEDQTGQEGPSAKLGRNQCHQHHSLLQGTCPHPGPLCLHTHCLLIQALPRRKDSRLSSPSLLSTPPGETLSSLFP